MLIATSILASISYTYAENKTDATYQSTEHTERDSHLKTAFNKLAKKIRSHHFSRENNGEEWKRAMHNLVESAHKIVQSKHNRQIEDTKKIMQKYKKDLYELTLLNLDLSSQYKQTALDFSYANFSKSILHNAKLINSNFRNSNFRDADLTGTNFQGADLRGACFDNAVMIGVNMVEAITDDKTSFNGVKYNSKSTVLPEKKRTKEKL